MRCNATPDQSGLAELSRQLAIGNGHSMSHNEASMHGDLFRAQESQPWNQRNKYAKHRHLSNAGRDLELRIITSHSPPGPLHTSS